MLNSDLLELDDDLTVDSDAAQQVEQAIQKIADEERMPLAQARFWYDLRERLKQRGFYEQYLQDCTCQQKRIAEYRARWFPLERSNSHTT